MIKLELNTQEFNAVYKALALRKQTLDNAHKFMKQNLMEAKLIEQEIDTINDLLKRLARSTQEE